MAPIDTEWSTSPPERHHKYENNIFSRQSCHPSLLLQSYPIYIWGVQDCSINSAPQLHCGAALQKKIWSLWSTSLGALITPPFFLEQSAWRWNRLAKKCGAELKNVKRSSPKHPHSRISRQWACVTLLHVSFANKLHHGLWRNHSLGGLRELWHGNEQL
jgi:hypothetical protein